MTTWRGDQFLALTHDQLVKNFTKAGLYYVSVQRQALNVSQPYTRTRGGKAHRGQAPSAPGQYPRKLTGQLQRSMTWKLDTQNLVLSCGSSLDGYPTFLETGTWRMEPRPWQTLFLANHTTDLGRIIVGG